MFNYYHFFFKDTGELDVILRTMQFIILQAQSLVSPAPKVLLETDKLKKVLFLASYFSKIREIQSLQFESGQPGVLHDVEKVPNADFAHFQVGYVNLLR